MEKVRGRKFGFLREASQPMRNGGCEVISTSKNDYREALLWVSVSLRKILAE